MRISINFSFFFISLCCLSCKSVKIQQNSASPSVDTLSLQNWMQQKGGIFDSVLKNRNNLRVQIRFTQVTRTPEGKPVFSEYAFAADTSEYFYPASVVKFPIAVLALEEIGKLSEKGIDRNSMMITEAADDLQSEVYNEPGSKNGWPSVANYIEKIFLVSDNDAFNRLYELLGRDRINQLLEEKGYRHSQITHRLSLSRTLQQNAEVNPIRFLDSNATQLFNLPARTSKAALKSSSTFLGKGYYENGELLPQPFDFSYKNKFALDDLHRFMQAVIFPEAVPAPARFELKDDDRNFLLRTMSVYTHQSDMPLYSHIDLADSVQKCFAAAAGVGHHFPNFRVFSKSGGAYGFLTEVAFIQDQEKGVEFFLTATIYCNSDGILNDNKYDYQKTGYPFLRDLAKLVHEKAVKAKENALNKIN